jgi:pyruvate dehydrogenase E2 component (dihydrolipoamide acetyltransferase)
MIEFRLPSLGADMDEGTLLEWKVQPGDILSKGQIVAIVDTSKAAVDIESWHEGEVARLLVQPGQLMPVGTVMALLLEPGETAADAERYQPDARLPASADAASAGPMQSGPVMAERRAVSPVARRRAGELGIDLQGVSGSGPNGVVTLQDVERAAGAAAPKDRPDGMRHAIAAAMSRSKREIPHYYLAEPIPMARALDWLAQENAARPVTERLLPAVLLLKAVALALRRYPEFNGTFIDGSFHPASRVNPGVAISLRQGGLIAPALFDADRRHLPELMRDLSDLVKRVRAGSLRSSELSESTITVTQLGDQGVESVFGVIYPPQVALVGFGRVTERPWVEGGKIVVRSVLTASLAADHRVSDGHRGGLFLAALRDLMQQPEALDAAPSGETK